MAGVVTAAGNTATFYPTASLADGVSSTATDSVGGGGCSVTGTGGGAADAAGFLGMLAFLAAALGARRAIRRAGRSA